jgi:hypothetical protein
VVSLDGPLREKSIGGLDLNKGLGACRVSTANSSQSFSLMLKSKVGMLRDSHQSGLLKSSKLLNCMGTAEEDMHRCI